MVCRTITEKTNSLLTEGVDKKSVYSYIAAFFDEGLALI